jgi:hypothetical protein
MYCMYAEDVMTHDFGQGCYTGGGGHLDPTFLRD